MADVRFGSKADICAATSHVRFTPNSDIKCGKVECPLRANRFYGAVRGLRHTLARRRLMSSNELKNLLVEYVRLFPRNRVARIGHDRPFVIFHMSSPDAHEGRRCKQIGVRGNDEGRCGNSRNLREGVWRAEGLTRGFRLASMFVDLGPAFGTVRVSASIRWPDFPVNRRKFSYARNLNT